MELGLRLSGPRLQVLHAGDPHAEALRGYLGMGLERLSVLEQPAGADALPALAEHLRDSRAQLVLTGSQAETGKAPGCCPFLLAERLGWPLVVGLAGGEVEEQRARSSRLCLRRPPGTPAVRRQRHRTPAARQSAFGPARRGEIEAHEVEVVDDPLLAEDSLQPARPRPKRLKVIKAKTGAERMKAATARLRRYRAGTHDLSAEAGAEAIFKLLREEGVIR